MICQIKMIYSPRSGLVARLLFLIKSSKMKVCAVSRKLRPDDCITQENKLCPPPLPPPLPAPPPLSSCVFAIKPSSGQNQLRHCLHRQRANARLLDVTLQLRGPFIRGPNAGPLSSLRRSPQRFPPPRLMATSGGGASLRVQQVYVEHAVL